MQNINVTFHERYIMFTQQAASSLNRLTEDSPQVLAAEPFPRQYPQRHDLPTQPLNAPFQPIRVEHGLFEATGRTSCTNQAVTAPPHTMALHQAHLRGSALKLPPNPGPDLLYQSVTGFAIPPRRLNHQVPSPEYSFTLPHSVCVARTIDPQDGQRKIRQISEDVVQYYLRVVKVGKLPTDRQEDLASNWALTATSWPHDLSYRVNDVILEVQGRSHQTKSLPIDITEFVRTGCNSIVIGNFANSNSEEATSVLDLYAFAVEIIIATTHSAILKSCQERTVSPEDSLRAITHSLQPSSSGGDELIVSAARTCIAVFDPISQIQICDLPARGMDCKHRECFDLLTFLQTRPREEPHWPSEPYAWRCPICLADVRPHRILIDGFLKEVGEKLVSEGKEKTRSIMVEADGRWKPMMEARAGPERSTQELYGTTVSAPPATLVTEGTNAVRATAFGVVQTPEEKQKVVIDLREDR